MEVNGIQDIVVEEGKGDAVVPCTVHRGIGERGRGCDRSYQKNITTSQLSQRSHYPNAWADDGKTHDDQARGRRRCFHP